ncbi:hypothetical protein V8E54_009915 [Elaphomyces granulatus]
MRNSHQQTNQKAASNYGCISVTDARLKIAAWNLDEEKKRQRAAPLQSGAHDLDKPPPSQNLLYTIDIIF